MLSKFTHFQSVWKSPETTSSQEILFSKFQRFERVVFTQETIILIEVLSTAKLLLTWAEFYLISAAFFFNLCSCLLASILCKKYQNLKIYNFSFPHIKRSISCRRAMCNSKLYRYLQLPFQAHKCCELWNGNFFLTTQHFVKGQHSMYVVGSSSALKGTTKSCDNQGFDSPWKVNALNSTMQSKNNCYKQGL